MLDEVLNISLQTNAKLLGIDVHDTEMTSDELLVQQVLAGDETAFEQIFERYRRMITRVVARFFRERADIEEAVQQAFTKAYFSLDKFRGGESPLKSWLARIAVNVCYDEFRRRQRKNESLFAEMSDEEVEYVERIADGKAVPADNALIAEQLIEKFTLGLKPEDRVALALVYSQEYTLDEAADVIGITTSNLKSRLFRCRNHIRKRFGHFFADR
jgi:RNA polymerase sigma-70 factor (ECF subfamily)